jgi:hypothetical protein
MVIPRELESIQNLILGFIFKQYSLLFKRKEEKVGRESSREHRFEK